MQHFWRETELNAPQTTQHINTRSRADYDPHTTEDRTSQASHTPSTGRVFSSRIDDVLMSQGLATCRSPETQVVSVSGNSDHSAPLAKMPLDNMMLLRLGPDVAALPINSRHQYLHISLQHSRKQLQWRQVRRLQSSMQSWKRL